MESRSSDEYNSTPMEDAYEYRNNVVSQPTGWHDDLRMNNNIRDTLCPSTEAEGMEHWDQRRLSEPHPSSNRWYRSRECAPKIPRWVPFAQRNTANGRAASPVGTFDKVMNYHSLRGVNAEFTIESKLHINTIRSDIIRALNQVDVVIDGED